MRTGLKSFFYGFCILVFSACANEKLPKYTVLQNLRVLSLESDLPELNYNGVSTFTPSSSISLTPTISDVNGGGRALRFSVEFCLDLGISLGVEPTCAGNPTRTVVTSDQAVTTTATFLAPNFTGDLNTVTVDFSTFSPTALSLVATAFNSSTATQRFNGISFLVMVEIYPVGVLEEKVTAFKRVVISSTGKTRNQNPSGLEIRENGTEIGSLPSSNSTLEAFLPASQSEGYFLMNLDGSLSARTEVLETTWFLTGPSDIPCSKNKECTPDGLFSLSRTRLGELNTFYAPIVAVPTARGRVLLGVARDDRGGLTRKRYCTGICP